MRFFGEISFYGARYFGWQSQRSGVPTVQTTLENALTNMMRKPVSITGCGRTDTGVHARNYYFHFDADIDVTPLIYKLNSILPPDIAVHKVFQVHEEAHARFDAISRKYEYNLHVEKDPFLTGVSYYYRWHMINTGLLEEAASLILEFEDFTSFCKSRTDVQHKKCHVTESYWEKTSEGKWKYTIASNRFLRGMVRLIVGMCLQVQRGKLSLDDVRWAMENQTLLKRGWSVPPEGLFLTEINYPWLQNNINQ